MTTGTARTRGSGSASVARKPAGDEALTSRRGDPRGSSSGIGSTRCLTVLVAVRHPVIRGFVLDLIADGCNCATAVPDADEMLRDAIERCAPDLLLVDTGDFPACCAEALARFPRDRVIVVGPDPGSDYRHNALSLGAGAWIPRDALAQRLTTEVRRLHRELGDERPDPSCA